MSATGSTFISDNQKRKIEKVRRCGKGVKRKNCEKDVKNIPEGKRFAGHPRKRWLDKVENYLKKMDVKG
jgi:hypothetical protein